MTLYSEKKFLKLSAEYIVSIFMIKTLNIRQYVLPDIFMKLQNTFSIFSSRTVHSVKTQYFYLLTTSRRADDVVASDDSACSEELNAVIHNTLCVLSKTFRGTLRPVFQFYVQETQSGGHEFAISKQSPCAVCCSFLFNIICVFV